MAMTMEQHRQLGAVGYDQFSDPWASTTSANPMSQLYPTSLGSSNSIGFDALAKQQAARASSASMPYNSIAANAPSIAASGGYHTGPYGPQGVMNLSHELVNPPRATYNQSYSAAPNTSINTFSSTSNMFLGPFGNLSQPSQHDMDRRLSQQSTSSVPSRASYDVMDAGRGIIAMSQDLTTPKNVYGPRPDRASADSYGFPASHSPHSSISSTSTYPTYYNSSVDGSSVSDYGSQSDSMESMSSRTLPRPSGLMSSVQPPAPQSMMGQFNSKISSSTQKKHKCKVCDKRFTRPSSLQTHMYSHTGEKPYACEAEGCGRHFSVVSNLRRHRKVHRGDQTPDRESPEGSWVSEK